MFKKFKINDQFWVTRLKKVQEQQKRTSIVVEAAREVGEKAPGNSGSKLSRETRDNLKKRKNMKIKQEGPRQSWEKWQTYQEQ